MKKILSVFAIAALFASCKSNDNDSRVLGVSATEQQKVIHTKGVNDADRYTSDQLNDPNRIKISEEEARQQAAKQEIAPHKETTIPNNTVKSQPVAPAKRKASTEVYSPKPGVPHESKTVYQNTPPVNSSHTPVSSVPSVPSAGNNDNTAKDNTAKADKPYEVVNTTSKQTTPEPVEKKEGWSHAAKGTVIGAGSGAILGAMVSKKHGTGAIIGGVLGAGAGYIFGKQKDRKEDTIKSSTTQYQEY